MLGTPELWPFLTSWEATTLLGFGRTDIPAHEHTVPAPWEESFREQWAFPPPNSFEPARKFWVARNLRRVVARVTWRKRNGKQGASKRVCPIAPLARGDREVVRHCIRRNRESAQKALAALLKDVEAAQSGHKAYAGTLAKSREIIAAAAARGQLEVVAGSDAHVPNFAWG